MLQIEICHILHFTMAGSTIICPRQKVAVKLVLSEDLDKFCLAQLSLGPKPRLGYYAAVVGNNISSSGM